MLRVEKLEDRAVPAASVFVAGGFIRVVGTNLADDVELYQPAAGQPVSVFVDGVLTNTVQSARQVNVFGGAGNDSITNNTYIDSFLFGGAGNDVLQGGGGNDRMYGESGDDVVTNFVTDSNYVPIGANTTDLLSGGDGNDSLWGGWGSKDTLLGGAGADVLYDIVGGSNFLNGGAGFDTIIGRTGGGLPTNPISGGGSPADIVVSDPNDVSVVLFDAATQAAGPVLINNTLYVLNLGGGDISIDPSGADIELNYNGVQSTYPAASVKTIAGIGGAGVDTFVNNTAIRSVFYGQGGDDVLIGGTNADVLKGGAGNDYIEGRSGRDDISGDAGIDVLAAVDAAFVSYGPNVRPFTDIVRADYDPLTSSVLDFILLDLFDTTVTKKIRF